MLKPLKLTLLSCFFAGISLNPVVAVTIGDDTTKNVSTITYLSDVTFTGTPQENVTAVLQVTSDKTLTIGGGLSGDPDDAGGFSVQSGRAGKIEVRSGNTLTFGGSLDLQGGGRLDLVGNFKMTDSGAVGGLGATLTVTGTTLNLLANSTANSTEGWFTFGAGAIIGIHSTSRLTVEDQVRVTGNTTLNLTGAAVDLANNVLIDAEKLNFGAAGSISVDASSLDVTALQNGDAIVLISISGDEWRNSSNSLTEADLAKISLDTTSSEYFELELASDAKGILLRYTAAPIPEPSTYAVMGAVCALGLVLLRRRKKTK